MMSLQRTFMSSCLKCNMLRGTVRVVFCTRTYLKRNYSIRPPEMDDPDFQKLRVRKRVFAWALGMMTLGAAWIMKRKKKSKLNKFLEGCQVLPMDKNYSSKVELYWYKDCVLPGRIIKAGIMKDVQNFEARDSDIIVASFPKSGTTWIQELVYLISTGLDFIAAKSEVLETRFPYLEYPYPGIKAIAAKSKHTEQRFIKTHLPYWLLPSTVRTSDAKIVYITRNPKDVCVSYFHFLRMLSHFGYTGSFPEFAESFIGEKVPYSRFFGHVLSYWDKQFDHNILFLFFEDLIADPEAGINKIAAFLGKPLSAEDVTRLATHTRFDVMAQNSAVNYQHWRDLGLTVKGEAPFMRKGQIGDWKNYFSSELDLKMDDWISSNLKGTTLKFTYLPGEDK